MPILDIKKKVLIDEYFKLQSDFKVLFDKKLLRYLLLKESKEEWIDDEGKELDKKKDKPVKREYTKYVLLPYMIWEWLTEQTLSLDDISTKDLKECNKIIKEKLELYSDYLIPKCTIKKFLLKILFLDFGKR